MVDLATGTIVHVVNPSQVVQVAAPGLVRGLAILAGPTGPAGRNVTSVVRTSGSGAAGTTDTYTITYSDATTSTFSIYNGANGTPGANGTNGTNGTNGQGVPVGGTTGQVLAKNSATNYDTVWSTPSSGGGAGTVLARVEYNPTTFTTYTATATNADVDATNLAIAFTATTTSAMIFLEGFATGGSTGYYWSLRQSTTDVVGSTRFVSASVNARTVTTIKLTGLTIGNSYTYKWAHRIPSGGSGSMKAGGATAVEFTGSSTTYAGPAIMEARSA